MDNDANIELQSHGKVRGILVCIGAFLAGYAAVRVNYLFFFVFGLELDWVLVSVISYTLLFAVAVLFALLLGRPMSEVFPIKKPQKTMFFGSLFIFLGIWCFSITINAVQAVIFVESATDVTDAISIMSDNTPLIVSIFGIAVLPGIFEEMLCRGTMLHALKPLKREWVRILIISLMFGLMHGIPTQIAYSTALGAGFAYIVIKTGNLLYPIIWHFFINSFSLVMTTLFSGMSQGMIENTSEIAEMEAMTGFLESSPAFSSMMLGVALLAAGGGVLLTYGGVRRLNGISMQEVDRKKRTRVLITGLAAICTGFMASLASCSVLIIEQMNEILPGLSY